MVALEYQIIDCDQHYYETRDCVTRHIEPMYRDKAARVVEAEDGSEEIYIGDRLYTFTEDPFTDTPVKPGSLREVLSNLGASAFDKKNQDRNIFDSDVIEPMRPEYQNRDSRLKLMDKQGVEAAILLPSFGVTIEHFMKDDPDLTRANLRAFNRWLNEDWGFNFKERIYAPPMLSLLDVESAVEELEWALSEGARIVHLRAGPQGGKSPADPCFDPFWSRVNEAKIAVAFHIGESGYNEMFSVAYGEKANPSSHKQSALQWSCFQGDRPIMDTMAALIYGNLFGRYPNIRVVSLENGCLWVSYLLKLMDKMVGMGRNGPWIGGRIKDRPSHIFKEHVYVAPYHEEDATKLANDMGVERVLCGSDFPHCEGLIEPEEFTSAMKNMNAADIKKVMRDNGNALLGRT